MQAKYNSVFWGEGKYLKDGVGFLAKTQTPPVELFVYCTIEKTVHDSSNICNSVLLCGSVILKNGVEDLKQDPLFWIGR